MSPDYHEPTPLPSHLPGISTKGHGVSDQGAQHRADEDEVVSRGRWFARRGVVAAVAVVLAVVAGVTAVSLLGSDPEPSTTGAPAADAARDDADRAARNNM